jgi:hypothetical protein
VYSPFHVPEVDVPEVEVPEVEVPEVDVPEVEVPEVDVPEVDVPEVEVEVEVGVGVGVGVEVEVDVGDGFNPHFIKHSSNPKPGATGKTFLINSICCCVKLVVASNTSSPNLNKLFAVVWTPGSSELNAGISIDLLHD